MRDRAHDATTFVRREHPMAGPIILGERPSKRSFAYISHNFVCNKTLSNLLLKLRFNNNIWHNVIKGRNECRVQHTPHCSCHGALDKTSDIYEDLESVLDEGKEEDCV